MKTQAPQTLPHLAITVQPFGVSCIIKNHAGFTLANGFANSQHIGQEKAKRLAVSRALSQL